MTGTDYERAWHLATRLSGCTTYVMVDKFQDIDKKQWKNEFDVFNILDEKDVKELLEKINSL
ncbi:MAG: hypothetical protein KGI02_09870 [Thaumarchaeota archaeon]|nr:hypothetical protein [Nitrososphaerota archaeon]MDE1832656.1 hypothetical protein [Nitrososphaerota archaeon]MDE1840512.1 hypothetical protein [Nitrososphaerota archaeon]